MIHLNEKSDDDLLPARMLNEFVYCPRLFYLEHVDGLFHHNADTLEGNSRHQRVDKKTDALPKVSTDASSKTSLFDDPDLDPPEKIHARSVTLSSEHFGIIAKLDLVEAHGDRATPVDYKKGSPKKGDDGSLSAWDPERVQLCAQALVLRENGYQCDEGVIYFATTRQRVRIPIDEALIAITTEAIQAARETMASIDVPPPLEDSPKCPRCSLVSICLPDETRRCKSVDDESNSFSNSATVQPLLFNIGPQLSGQNPYLESHSNPPTRQLVTSRDTRRPLYLSTQGFSVGISSKVLQVKDKGRVVQKVRLNEINQVNLFGNVQVSTQAIGVLMTEEIPLIYFSFGGWFRGMTQPVGLKNIMWRREQFRGADDERFCLQLARDLVVGKIRNQRTMLMRNHIEPPAKALNFLKTMTFEAERAQGLAQLLGIEGSAARCYFEHFAGMIKINASTDDGDPFGGDELLDHRLDRGEPIFTFDFERRNRRPPRDPINALLSLGYSVLSKDMTVACAAAGLDPYLGFYHQPRFGRPALALDLMEPFRPLAVDSAILSAINQRMITPKDFIAAGDAVALTPNGRKSFFQAYEQRMNQLVTHPLFGYRVSYRRLLEIQVRLLARVLLGEIRRYPVFTTR